MKKTLPNFLLLLLLFLSGVSLAQTKISGTVTDDTGGTLPGVSITIKGTTQGTVSNADGEYSLDVPDEGTLLFSFVGMKSQEIALTGQTEISIAMESETIGLDDVVVVGYGVQKKATLTGSVTSVSGEDMIKTPVTNVSQGLAGRLPGVVAISNTGEPGYDGATIRIRGVNTFGNADPLVVVDGVPGRSLDRIDPNTIESMSVMKDASAAIYGAQAANGVILITTKRGTTGKPRINASYNQGFARPTVLPEMADAAQYATLLNEIDYYANRNPRYTDEEIQLYQDGSDPLRYPNTDWFAETIKPWSSQTHGNVSIDGGTERVKYFVSMSEKSQDGIYKNSATKYNQYDFKSNLDINVNKYLDLTVNTGGRYEYRQYPTRSAENIFRMLMRSKPNSPAYWPNGLPGPDIEFGDNPVVITTDATGYNRDKRYIMNSDFGFNFKVPGVEGLSVKGTASIDRFFKFQKQWFTPWYLYSWDGSSLDENGDPVLVEGKKGYDDSRLRQDMEDSGTLLLNGTINYNRTFKANHTLNFLVGAEKISNKGDVFGAYRRYFLSPEIDQLFAGGQEDMNNWGSGWEQARLNYFGRVNYDYKKKYVAEFVWRYQGSYIFPEESRFGFFPGVSLGYVVSEEDFWKEKVGFIDFLKLRGSWGQTGNDLVDEFQYMALFEFNDLNFVTNGGESTHQALYEGVVPNIGITWETAIQRNVGIDLRTLNGDLSLTVDYFHNHRSDILTPENGNIPYTTGFVDKQPDKNIGEVTNQGVDFSVDYHKRMNDLHFGIGVNGVYAKNEINYWNETDGVPEYQQSTGRPIGADLYYEAIGIYQTEEEIDNSAHWQGARPGDIIFRDVNEDGMIDGNDRVRYDKSRTPVFTGGLNLSAGYKNFDFSALFQGAFGGMFYETTESGDFGNYLASFYDERWTEENPSTEHPRTYNRNGEYWVTNQNTYWMHKTDYVRLKSIELGYTLPKTLTNKVMIDRLRFYVSAFNLFTIAPDMPNYDPEATNGSGYSYPLSQVINCGVNVTF